MSLETPWTRARKSKHEQQEARLGASAGGSRQINSGRTWRSKRDAKLYNFLVEARTTESGSYRIERAEWLDIRKQGFQTPPGLLPAMQIDFNGVSLFVMELGAFEEMQVEIMQLQAKVAKLERELS